MKSTPPRKPSISLPGRKMPFFQVKKSESEAASISSGVCGWALNTNQDLLSSFADSLEIKSPAEVTLA